ncbi:hypothetical protein Holit_01053 [Hollandina sp. SP2]
MPLVHRCGYGSADLFYDFTGNFLVFYLRWLYGFDLSGHFVTSCFECIRFWGVGRGEKFDALDEKCTFFVYKNGFTGITLWVWIPGFYIHLYRLGISRRSPALMTGRIPLPGTVLSLYL